MLLSKTDGYIHDVSLFPIVFFNKEKITAGYGVAWSQEMDVLLTRNKPFVMIFSAWNAEESHEDRKIRGLWLKQNKQMLARLCKATIIVSQDVDTTFEAVKLAEKSNRAFNIPYKVVATRKEAVALANQLLNKL